MKKMYAWGLAMISSMAMAQEVISFETSEGFDLGSIHNQNGWTVTEGIDGFLSNQIITDEKATDGSFSFKNSDEAEFDFQWFPIFGAAKEFETPFSNQNFSISYDVLVTESMGADFEFTLFSKDEIDEYYPIAGVGMEYRGNLYLIHNENYGSQLFENVNWTPNEWNQVKIEINPSTIHYYFNDELVYTIENFNPVDIAGFNMLHNNYGGSAYYDHFKIETDNLLVNDWNVSNLSVYPNPAKDILNIQLNSTESIATIEIYSLVGQKVKQTKSKSTLNVGDLKSGTYVLKIQTTEGKVYTRKFIKE